jgi:Tfp pilus assembly protein PilX
MARSLLHTRASLGRSRMSLNSSAASLDSSAAQRALMKAEWKRRQLCTRPSPGVWGGGGGRGVRVRVFVTWRMGAEGPGDGSSVVRNTQQTHSHAAPRHAA